MTSTEILPDQLTQKGFRRLLQIRVCTCWCHAPCAACTDPVSPKELAEINEQAEHEARAMGNLKPKLGMTEVSH